VLISCIYPDPLVLYGQMGHNLSVLQQLEGRPFHLYVRMTWHLGHSPSFFRAVLNLGGTITVCANSEAELDFYTRLGVDCILCHHNAFLDWNIHKLSQSPIEYDFVVNSVLLPYKRLHLIPAGFRYALISRVDADKMAWRPLRPAWKNTSLLQPAEVNAMHNQCRAGVILSEEEGGCNAATEYLLAGLPVISTPSRGGRDLFFTPNNAIICEPRADSLKQAIEFAIQAQWPREQIRDECIAQMREHRLRFVEHLGQVISGDGQQALEQAYTNRLLRWFSTDDDGLRYLKHAIATGGVSQ